MYIMYICIYGYGYNIYIYILMYVYHIYIYMIYYREYTLWLFNVVNWKITI